MFHLLINGRPLCVHTACVAGLDDAEAAQVRTCSFELDEEALDAARAWKAAHPHHAVALGLGDCPEPEPDAEDRDPDLIECDALVVRDGPVSITRDTGAEREETVARFATIADAVSFLGRWAGIDPDDLAAGRYGINAPHGVGSDAEAEEAARRLGTLIEPSAAGWRYRYAGLVSGPYPSPAAAALACLTYRDPG